MVGDQAGGGAFLVRRPVLFGLVLALIAAHDPAAERESDERGCVDQEGGERSAGDDLDRQRSLADAAHEPGADDPADDGRDDTGEQTRLSQRTVRSA